MCCPNIKKFKIITKSLIDFNENDILINSFKDKILLIDWQNKLDSHSDIDSLYNKFIS